MADANLIPFTPSAPATYERLSYPEIIQVGKVMQASGFFPDLKSEAQAAVKIMFGQELAIPPIEAVLGIYVFPAGANRVVVMLSGNLTSKLMVRAGYRWEVLAHDASICELQLLRDGEKVGEPVAYTIDMAKRAGLTTKDNWKGYAEDMLFSRAIARLCKRYCPEATSAMSFDVIDAETADELPVDPRDDLMRALFASLPPELKTDRDERLAWASATLGREVRSFNGPGFEDELSRVDVQALLDAAEDTTMFAPEPEPGVVSPGPAQPSGPGGSSGPDERSSGVADGEAVAPEVQAGAQAEPPRPTSAPSRSHNKPESAKAAVERVREHQAVASETRHRVTEAAPSNWLASLPPEARVNILTHTSDDQEAAERIVRFFAKGMELSEEWSDERLAKLAAATWRSRG